MPLPRGQVSSRRNTGDCAEEMTLPGDSRLRHKADHRTPVESNRDQCHDSRTHAPLKRRRRNQVAEVSENDSTGTDVVAAPSEEPRQATAECGNHDGDGHPPFDAFRHDQGAENDEGHGIGDEVAEAAVEEWSEGNAVEAAGAPRQNAELGLEPIET